MHYFRIVMVAMLCLATYATAHADDTPAKTFLPLAGTNKAMQDGHSAPAALPTFLPLKMRPLGKPLTHNATLMPQSPQEDDIPVAREGAPEAMTEEQATQIISLFGAGE